MTILAISCGDLANMVANLAMSKIVFALYPKALVTGISGPMEMFQAAEQLLRVQRSSVLPSIVQTVSQQSGWVEGVGGLKVMADLTVEQCNHPDFIFIPPLWGNPLPTIRTQQVLAEWIKEMHHAGATVIATGTGVCLLAECGLLNGKPATTHWFFFDRFRKLYPEVELNVHKFITYQEGIYCAGSINALTDLVIFLIKQHYGTKVSSIVEQHFSHEINRTFDAQFFSGEGQLHHDEDIIRAQDWINSRWNQEVVLSEWAQAIDMPVRTFNRRFLKATGMTPIEYLQAMRIRMAMDILRDSNLNVTEVSELSGYRDSGYFTRLFKKISGVSPAEYRKIVRSKLFMAE